MKKAIYLEIILAVISLFLIPEDWIGNEIRAQSTKNLNFTRIEILLTQRQTYEDYLSAGVKLEEEEKYEEARTAYQKAIELEPNKTDAYVALGKLLEKQEKFADALQIYQKIIEIAPQDWSSYLPLAEFFLGQGEEKKALEVFEKAIQVKPSNLEAYSIIGSILELNDKNDKAIAIYRQQVEIFPDEIEGYINLGYSLTEQKNYDEAIAIYQKAIYLDPQNDYLYLRVAQVWEEKGESNNAIKIYRELIQRNPTLIEAYLSLGQLLEKQNDFAEAIKIYKESIRKNPDKAEGYLSLGKLLENQNNFAEAATIYRQLINRNPEEIDGYTYLGHVLLQQGKLEETLTIARRFLEIIEKISKNQNNLDREDLDLQLSLYYSKLFLFYSELQTFSTSTSSPIEPIGSPITVLYSDEELLELFSNILLKILPEAAIVEENLYRRIIQENPKLSNAYFTLIEDLLLQKKIEEALEYYRRMIALDYHYPSEDLYPLLLYGDLDYSDNQIRLNQKIIQKMIELDPEDPTGYLYLGDTLSEQKNWNKALENYQKFLNLVPNYFGTYYNLASIMHEQKQFEQARYFLQKAIKINPKDANAYLFLGNLYAGQEKWQRAIETYQKIIQLDANFVEAHNNLCWAFAEIGNLPEALKQCEEAVSLTVHYPVVIRKEFQLNLEEIQRLLALQQNPQLLNLPEVIPSNREDNLVSRKRSIVRIIAKTPNGYQFGTGWFVKKQGNKAWILTNRHVVTQSDQQQPAKQIEVEFFGQPPAGQFRRRKDSKLVNITSPQSTLDLAVLEVTDLPVDIQPLLISSNPTNLNTSLRVIGHPIIEQPWYVLEGKINKQNQGYFQLSNIIFIGNSGSPVLDEQNRVIGMVSHMIYSCYQSPELFGASGCGIGFSSSLIEEQLKRWRL